MSDSMIGRAISAAAMDKAAKMFRCQLAAQLMAQIGSVYLVTVGPETGKLDKGVCRLAGQAAWDAAGILMEIAGLT